MASGSLSKVAKYLFPPKIASLSVIGTDTRFPVRRIFCIGKNYTDHVIEMGGDAAKDPPLWFTKPADAVVDCHHTKSVHYPPHTKNLHWEAELVVAIGKPGRFLTKKEAMDHVFGFAVGVDLTCRDVQNAAKKKGRPWDMSKGFDESAPIGAIVSDKSWLDYDTELQLKANGEVKQSMKLGGMIWPVADVISDLSQQVQVEAGDIIFTGTPAGVGECKVQDFIVATCGNLPPCEFVLVDKAK